MLDRDRASLSIAMVAVRSIPAYMRPITEIAERLGLPADLLEPYGRHIAKIRLETLDRFPDRRGKLILVTAITPTTSGEGKTVNTIGITQGLTRLGHKAVAALRQPSLGPVFGMKGGATGGGQASLEPVDKINLHFTGDFHAITAAHNLLAALLDTHLHFGNELRIDPKEILWPRAMDMNDRALRRIATGLGGRESGPARETGFVITAASEIMAILALVGEPRRLAPAARPHRRRLQLRRQAGHGGRPESRRRDDAAAERRDSSESRPDHRRRAGDRPLRPVRQHRARHEQRAGAADRSASGRLRRQRNGICRGPWRREVLRPGDADVRTRSVGRRRHRDAEGVADAGRKTGWPGRCRLSESEEAPRESATLGRAGDRRAQSLSRTTPTHDLDHVLGLLPIAWRRSGVGGGLYQGRCRNDGAGEPNRRRRVSDRHGAGEADLRRGPIARGEDHDGGDARSTAPRACRSSRPRRSD